jgi:hypothetical protein
MSPTADNPLVVPDRELEEIRSAAKAGEPCAGKLAVVADLSVHDRKS